MATKIKLKKSSVTGKQPQVSDLDHGELAVNYADGVLYYKNTSNTIASISGGGAEADSAAPAGAALRAGDLWWDAVNGRLKIYYDDGQPTNSPITVSAVVNNNTDNANYSFNSFTDRATTHALDATDVIITLQQGDTLNIDNTLQVGNHPLYYVTQLDAITSGYNSSYNVVNPAANYGGGTVAVSYQFNSAGTYWYVCGVHPNMRAEIRVVATGTASKQWVDASPQGRGYTGSAGAIGYSENAPANPSGGQIWWDAKTGKAYMWYIVSGYGHWTLFADPTVTDGDTGYTGSKGYTGSVGTISPRLLTIVTPTLNDEQTLLYTGNFARTVDSITAVIRGTVNVEYALYYASNRDEGTPTEIATDTVTNSSTGQSATISNAAVPANSWIWAKAIAVNGAPEELNINIVFTE